MGPAPSAAYRQQVLQGGDDRRHGCPGVAPTPDSCQELRYEMELLAGAFPPDFVEKLYPVVEILQQHLGEINDHATAQAHLRQRIDTANDPSETDHLRTLLKDETARLNQSRRTFLQWWN